MNQNGVKIIVAGVLWWVAHGAAMSGSAESIQLEQKVLPSSNPLFYEFDAKVATVKGAVTNAFNRWKQTQRQTYRAAVWQGEGTRKVKESMTETLRSSARITSLLWQGEADSLSKGVLSRPENQDDAYIYGDVSPFGQSAVYFKDHQPVIYYADFHIHLSAVQPGKTRVQITPYGMRVATGLDTSWQAHGPSLIFVQVPATTVEEYELLLAIGTELGAKDMPKLIVPAPDAPSKTLKLPRAY